MKKYTALLFALIFIISCDTIKFNFSTEAAKEDLLGWQKFSTYPEITKKITAKIATDQSTPETTAAAFIASIMKGDNTFKTLLHPKSQKKDAIIYDIKKNYKPVKKWIFRAIISTKKANNNKPFKGRIYLLKKYFGSFDKMIFIEDETSRWDTFLLMGQKGSKWYVVAPLGHLFFNPDSKK